MRKMDISTIIERALKRGLEVVEDLRDKNSNNLLFRCLSCKHEFIRHAGNMHHSNNDCPKCYIKNRPNKIFKCEICSKAFEVSAAASNAKLCSKECKDIYIKNKANSIKKEYFCSSCGKSKGFLHAVRVDGKLPHERPCRDCSSKEVGLKHKGRSAWNKGIPLSLNTKEKLRQSNLGKIPSNKGSKVSYETKIKIHCSVNGIALNEFNGFSQKSERHEFKMLGLSKQCLERDNYTCQCCNAKGVHLNAHHKNSWKHYAEDRLLLSNLITLCLKCHKEFHAKYGSGCKKPNTKEQLNEFLKEKSNGEK